MYTTLQFIKKHWFGISLLSITIFAGFLRFYNYANRWGFAYDQAHDAIIARYALTAKELPLLGPFSSAGAFQTGGEWYWFIMIGTFLFPFFANGAWIFLTLVQTCFVSAIGWFARQLIDKKFALLTALLAAISVGGINQSINLTNQAILNIISLAVLYCSFKYIQTQKSFFIFLLGLFVGLGASIHLQGIALSAVAVTTVIFAKNKKIHHLFFLLLGGIIPWIPIFIVDVQNNFYNTKNMLQYYLHDQYKIPLEVFGRRWLTYGGVFWPNAWAVVIGGQKILGYLFFFGSFLTVIWALLKKKVSSFWALVLCSFILMIVMLRYVRTPLFDSYLMFLHPFIFLFSAFFIYQLVKKHIFFSVIIIVIIYINLMTTVKNITSATNDTSNRALFWFNLLLKTYPNKQFFMYDYRYGHGPFSLPLIFYMQYYNKLSVNGYKISFGKPDSKYDPQEANSFPEIQGNTMGFNLIDVNASTAAQLKQTHFVPIDPEYVYHATQDWYK